jgi:hypothetical protein
MCLSAMTCGRRFPGTTERKMIIKRAHHVAIRTGTVRIPRAARSDTGRYHARMERYIRRPLLPDFRLQESEARSRSQMLRHKDLGTPPIPLRFFSLPILVFSPYLFSLPANDQASPTQLLPIEPQTYARPDPIQLLPMGCSLPANLMRAANLMKLNHARMPSRVCSR